MEIDTVYQEWNSELAYVYNYMFLAWIDFDQSI